MTAKGILGLKACSIAVILCMTLFSLTSLLFSQETATGEKDIKDGILRVNTLDTLNIEQSTYQVAGINVTNGNLKFTNTTVNIQMDLGADGTLGTSDDHTFGIVVATNGKLTFENCVLTVTTTQSNPYLYLNIRVTGSQIAFKNTTVACPGRLFADASTVTIINTHFKDITPPSTVSNIDLYDDGLEFEFKDCDDVNIQDSYFNDTPVISSTGRDILINNSDVWAINSYFDVDFKKNTTSASNKLQCILGSNVYLYGCALNETENLGTHDASAITVDATSTVIIHRMLDVSVNDVAGVPLSGINLDINYQYNATTVPAPSAKILSYLGKAVGNWDITDEQGMAVLPLRSDIISIKSFPNSDFVGRYTLKATINSVIESFNTTLTAYPGNGKGNITWENFPMIYLNSTQYLNTPVGNPYYSSVSTIAINNYVNLTGSYSVVDGKVYNSYYSLDKSIVVQNSGHLKIKDTYLHLLQDKDTHFYILVKNGGVLELDNVTIFSKNDQPINIYVIGTGSDNPTIKITGSDLLINTMSVKGSGSLFINSTVCQGSLYMKGSANSLTANDAIFNNTFMVLDQARIALSGSNVITDSLSIKDSTLSAINTTFNQHLTFSSVEPTLTNVTFAKTVAAPQISVQGSITADIYWWVSVNVFDRFFNPLPDANVTVWKYDNTLTPTTVVTGTTQAPLGSLMFKLLEKTIYKDREEFLGNYMFNASFQNTLGTASLKLGQSTMVNISINGAPDLRPGNITYVGPKIMGTDLTINAKIFNQGSFSASNIWANFYNGPFLIGTTWVDKISAGKSVNITNTWTNIPIGLQNITVSVDPNNNVKEMDELNNNLTNQVIIGMGPDYVVSIVPSNYQPTQNELVNFTATVVNYGGLDIGQNPITIDYYLGDPDYGGVFIATHLMTAVGATAKLDTINYTFVAPGIQSIFAILSSFYSNDKNFTNVDVKAPADLVISSQDITFSRPSPVGVGQSVDIYVTIYNNGDSDASNVYIEIYDILVHAKIHTQAIIIPIIKANSFILYNFTNWKTTVEGLHTIEVRVDPYPNRIIELNESNNNASSLLTFGKEPDLTPTGVTFNPDPVTNGTFVKITLSVKNNGGTPAYGVIVRFYIDTTINLINLTTIDIAEKSTQAITIYYRTVQEGLNTLILTVDENNLVTESDETNNQLTDSFLVISRPNLIIYNDGVTFDSSEPIDNGIITNINVTIRNTGETAAGEFKVSIYDGNPTQAGKTIGTAYYTVASIEPNGQSWIRIPWNTTVTGGYHYLYIIVDTDQVIDESIETDNVIAKEVWVKTIPDLYVTNSDLKITTKSGIPIDTCGVNTPVSISVLVRNIGDTDAKAFKVEFFKTQPKQSGKEFLGSIVTTLSGNSEKVVSLPVTDYRFPEGGNITVYAEVDTENTVKENYETNNHASNWIDVYDRTMVPDLAFGNITILDSFGTTINQGDHVINGTTLTLTIEVANMGGRYTNRTTTLGIYYKDPRYEDGTLNVDYGKLTDLTIPNLRNESTIINVTTWTINSTGPMSLYLFLDSNGVLKEFEKDNNNYTVMINATPQPDFVASISVSKNKITEGDKVTITLRVITDYPSKGRIGYVIRVDGMQIKQGNFDEYGNAQVEWKSDKNGEFIIISGTVNTGTTPIPETNTDNNNAATTINVEKEKTTSPFLYIGIGVGVLLLLVIICVVVYFLVFKKKGASKAVCSECGAPLELDASVCPSCGAEFGTEVECGECGGLMAITDTKCPNCGAIYGEVPQGGLPSPDEKKPDEPRKESPVAPKPPAPSAVPAPAKPGAPVAPAGPGAKPGQPAAAGAEGPQEDVAECYMCGSIIPISAPMCPICGAEFE